MASYHSADATVSAKAASVVTPSNVTEFPVTRGLYVGVTGDVAVVLAENSVPIVFSNVPSGSVLPVQAKQVYSTNTTASAIVALY